MIIEVFFSNWLIEEVSLFWLPFLSSILKLLLSIEYYPNAFRRNQVLSNLSLFLLHMIPRLWEDVLELQKQAKLKDNVIFSAQGAPQKNLEA